MYIATLLTHTHNQPCSVLSGKKKKKADSKYNEYRAFHNVLCDYKHLQQENQRTYLNGIVQSNRKTEKGFFDN